MAKEILDAVRNAEAECAAVLQKAKADAARTEDDAAQQAEALLQQRSDEAHRAAEEYLGNIKAECARIVQEAEQASAEDCKAISATADQNRDAVIQAAVEKFF